MLPPPRELVEPRSSEELEKVPGFASAMALSTRTARPAGRSFDRSRCLALHVEYQRSRCLRLRNRLVELHLNLVRQQAHRLAQNCNLSVDDLVQIGSLGLIKAVEGFDPQQGHAFSTYAVPFIQGQMKHYLRDRHSPIRCSWRLRELYGKCEQLQQTRQHGGLAPLSREALGLRLGCSADRIQKAQELHRALQLSSLDGSAGLEEGESLQQQLVDRRPGPEQRLLWQELEERLQQLAPVDQRLLRDCLLEGRPQRQLAQELQWSPCQVSRRLRQLCAQLRQQLSPTEPWLALQP